MEKLNKKTIIIGLIIAAVIIAGIVCLALFNSRGKETSEKDLKAVTEVYESYIYSMTLGYPTQYLGMDKLYAKDEITYDDLHRNVILNVAARYASTNLDNAIDQNKIAILRSQYGYDTTKYVMFKGEAIKEAVKILFGKDFKHGSGVNDNLYGYDYVYVASQDIYLKSKGSAYMSTDGSHYLDYKTIKSTTKGTKVEMEVAIAYVHKISDKLVYTSDADANKIIFEATIDKPGIQDKHLDKFQKYIVTFNMNEKDNTFTFDSIKKAK